MMNSKLIAMIHSNSSQENIKRKYVDNLMNVDVRKLSSHRKEDNAEATALAPWLDPPSLRGRPIEIFESGILHFVSSFYVVLVPAADIP